MALGIENISSRHEEPITNLFELQIQKSISKTVDFFVICEKIILKERMVSVMKIIKRDKIKFGLVVTLKEINGENRIDEFIQRCFFNQWFVEKVEVENKIELYNKAEEEIILQ